MLQFHFKAAHNKVRHAILETIQVKISNYSSVVMPLTLQIYKNTVLLYEISNQQPHPCVNYLILFDL